MSRSRNLRASSRRAAHRRSGARPQLGSVLRRATLGTVVVAGAALLGLSGTAALWSSTASVAVAPISSGSLDIRQSAVTDASVAYASSTTRKTAALTVRNTGTTSGTVSAAVTTSGDSTLAGAVSVNLWRVSAATACTEGAASSGDATSWNGLNGVSAPIAAGETQVYCLRTSLTTQQINALAGRSYTATLSLTAKRGNWTSTASFAPIAQSVARATTTAPRLTCTDNGGWNLKVDWNNPNGAPDSVRYQVRTGSTVLASNGSYWYTEDWIERSAFSNLARNRTYPIEVVRTDTGAVVATGSIRYDSNGQTWCA